jgi:hypothetical protein
MKTSAFETPFLEAPSYSTETQESPLTPSAVLTTPWLSGETPFMRDAFETIELRGAEVEAISELLANLRDEAFEHDIYQLAAQARGYLGDRYQGEFGEAEAQYQQAERELEQFFSPLVREAEAMYDRLAEGLAAQDAATISERQVDYLLNQYAPAPRDLTPEFEEFVGGLFRKATGLLKGAIGKVAGAALGPLLKKLRGLVRPLVSRVIQFALNRLPVSVRPIAQKIAGKLLGRAAGEPKQGAATPPNATTAEMIQREYDLQVADLLVSDSEVQQEYPGALPGELEAGADSGAMMQAAKAEFAEQFAQLQPGQDPGPVVQQFLPAALMAAKPLVSTAIRIIGRPRVVGFIGKLIAGLIGRWVGAQEARTLSNALASAGLGVLGFETPQPDARPMAAELLAETLESTVTELAQLPEAVLENDVMLEAATRDAFERAAAAYFPDSVIRPEVRETANAPGMWMPMPRTRKRKYYRKYSRVLDVEITPQIAQAVRVFGGSTLADFLEQVMLQPTNRTVKGKMHLYELTLGSRLVDIAAREQAVPGLGTGHWTSWSQLHPLTPEAATALLKEPGLGKTVEDAYLAGPYLTAVGQRFYYLQLPGAQLPRRRKPMVVGPKGPAPGGGTPPSPSIATPTCANQVSVLVDLGGARVVVRLQFSEATAQEIAQALRRKDIAGAWRIAKSMDRMLRDVVTRRSGGFTLRGFELEEYVGEPEYGEAEGAGKTLLAGLAEKLLDKILDKLMDLAWEGIANYFKNTATEFIRATEDPADGIVVYAAFVNIPGFAQIRNLRQGVSGVLSGSLGSLLPTLDLTVPRPSISVHAGCSQ